MKINFRKLIAVGTVFAATSFLATAAFADTFSFSFGAPNATFSGSGTLTASPTGSTTSGDPIFLITGVTGFTDGQAITNILAPGTFPVGLFGMQPGNDNLLTDPAGFKTKDGHKTTHTYFDSLGLSYELADGLYVNISDSDDVSQGYNFSISRFWDGSWITQSCDEPITITDTTNLTPTPEPSSLLLLGTGLFGLAFLLYRRKAGELASHATLGA